MDTSSTEPKPDNRFVDGDPRRLNVNDPSELQYWMKYLDISEGALRATIGAVGNVAQDVKDYLARLEPPSADGT